jgi:probable rRNA maturation factor
MKPERLPDMRIDVTNQTGTHIDSGWIQDLSRLVLDKEGRQSQGPVSIVFINDEEMTGINREFFGKRNSTDVISFNFDNDLPTEEESRWGELYISVDRACEQAHDYRISPEKEIARLVIHGLLHLTGYRDDNLLQKMRMRRKENQYLKMTE